MTAAAVDRPSSDDRITAALWFAAKGFGVFPVWSTRDGQCRCPLGLACTSPGKHPITTDGFKSATTDPARIRTFLAAKSDPNYGMVPPDGVFVWDVDSDEERTRLAALETRHGPLPPTLRDDTGNGQHLFLRWPDGLPRPLHKMFGFVTRWGSGSEAMQGYVVGPLSIHVSGRVYRSAAGSSGDIATLPDEWARAAVEPQDDTIRIGGRQAPEDVHVGGRHDWLRNTARLYAGVIRDADALFAAVWAENEKLPTPKTRDEVLRAIGDVLLKFPADPLEHDPDTGETRRLPRDESGDLLGDEARAPFPEPPDRAAFGGLAGELVASILDGTDASEVGVLVSLLTFAGALVPSRAYILNRNHVSALHVCLVGESSIGRKTTAMDRAQDTMKATLGEPVVNRVVMTGTNSGEALVTALEKRQIDYKREPTTALVYEQEYATLLSAVSREGSSLDARLRLAFDGTQAMANKRQAGSQSVQPPYWLAALVGITPSELQEKAPTGVLRSGSANRWLWLPVAQRDEGGDWPPLPGLALRQALAAAHDAAWSEPMKLEVDPEVRGLLSAYGAHLRKHAAGQAVDLSLRYPTIAVRIAMIHAALDRSQRVTVEHASRGIAVTEYAHEGVPWAWGYAVGDPLATYLLRDLVESGGLTKTQITQRWSRDQIRGQKAIDELRRLRFIETVRTRATGGRPRTEVRLRADHARFVRFFTTSATEPTDRRNPSESQKTQETQITHETQETQITHETSTNGQNEPQTKPKTTTKPSTTSQTDPETRIDPATGQVGTTETVSCSDYRAHHTRIVAGPSGFHCAICHPELGATP